MVLAGLVLISQAAYPQERGGTSSTGRGQFQLKETEITGKLKDVLGSLKLLETEIVGTVERPRLSYSVPWQDPDPLSLEEGEVEGGFLKGIYTPLDKETFSREIRAGMAP